MITGGDDITVYSTHEFNVNNLTDDDQEFSLDYDHHLQFDEFENDGWVDVADDEFPRAVAGEDGNFDVDAESSFDHNDFANLGGRRASVRFCGTTNARPGRYRLTCYTEVRPPAANWGLGAKQEHQVVFRIEE